MKVNRIDDVCEYLVLLRFIDMCELQSIEISVDEMPMAYGIYGFDGLVQRLVQFLNFQLNIHRIIEY